MSLNRQLTQQFITLTRNYQKLDIEDRLKWDTAAIIKYAQDKDKSLLRKNKNNLLRAATSAINELKEEITEDSQLTTEEMDEIITAKSFNTQLLGIYQNNIDISKHSTENVKDSPMREGTREILPRNEATKRKNTPLKERTKKIKLDSDPSSKWPTPKTKFADLGGIESIAEDLMQLIGMPLRHPEIYRHLGVDPPRGILLHGPPGCGKTLLANAIAGEANVPFISIAAPVIVSGMSGESEKKIREVFEEAKQLAPCILFIDEIDAITPKRETAQREMERRIVAQLLTCMDDLSLDKTDYKPVMIIGATNRPDSLYLKLIFSDPALRRAGRFDREILLGVPNEQARTRILQKMCGKLRLEGSIDFQNLARLTPGYVGADLNALTAEAGLIAVRRIFGTIASNDIFNESTVNETGLEPEYSAMVLDEPKLFKEPNDDNTDSSHTMSNFLYENNEPLTNEQLQSLCVRFEDFVAATKIVQPSSKREGFASVPDVSWEDIGALYNVAEELRMAIVEPIKHPERFSSVGIESSMGVLLYGPPGCGKTLLAKAVANESQCNFLSVKGPELLNKYVGESERAIRMVFSRAQASSPCVIFFDELDALCPSRSNDSESQSSSRLVNTLLTEMDGMTGRKQVFVIAATNRPDMIDPAMLRPGRLDKALYVDLPNNRERFDILKTLTRKTPLSSDVDLVSIANHDFCEGMSGADLSALVRQAATNAVKLRYYSQTPSCSIIPLNVCHENIIDAFAKVKPSVSAKQQKKYELLKVKFGTSG